MRPSRQIAGAVRRAGALGEGVWEDTVVVAGVGPEEVVHLDAADPAEDSHLEVDD